MNVLVPKFLQATEHPSEQIRVHALNCLNQFIQHGSNALINHIDAFIQALFKRASDEKAMVRRFVCQALVYILGWRPDKLLPEMNNVVEYMLYSTQDQDEEVALEACEFWLQFAEDPSLAESLRPYVNKIAPVLLKGMVYSEIDVLMLDGDDDDAAVPDKPEDIKPRFGAPKLHKNERTEENGDSNNVAGGGKSRAAIDAEANKGGDEDEDDYDDDSDYDEDEDALAEWNLRKCSAAALDVMAITFPDELLNVLLPLLKEKLFSSDWLQRESGILALGAIAEGCISGVQPHLPTLVPFLINCLSDSKPLVRSISCWTLGRYSSWCVSDKSSEHQTAYFVPTMEGLLLMALDNNKRVQEAGCSAFATLEEEAGASLAPFLEPVLKNLVFAFEQYQQKNLLILYDAIGTLADSVGSELNRPDYVSLLMPPLIAKWQTLSDDDQGLIPLLECLSSVTIAVGEAFLPYSPPVFQRCVAIVGNTLSQIQKEASLPEYEREAERTFVIVALDLLSGLTQGLAANVKELVQMSQPPLIPLLKICITVSLPLPLLDEQVQHRHSDEFKSTNAVLYTPFFFHLLSYFSQDSDAPVRQSAYALLGDLAISAFPLLRPNLEEIMPELIQQIEPEPRIDNISVCNNAAWCAGEIALQYGAVGAAETELQKWVDPLIQRLVPVLLNPKTVKSLSENAAVTIGRLGLVAPVPVAPHLNVFIESWCEALWDIKDNEEKDSAFRGMCEMIQLNPNGGEFIRRRMWEAKSKGFFCFRSLLITIRIFAFSLARSSAATKGFVYFCNAVVVSTTQELAFLLDLS